MFCVLLCVCYLQSVEAVYRALEGVGEGVTGAKCVLCTQNTTLYNTAIEQLNTATQVRHYTSYYAILPDSMYNYRHHTTFYYLILHQSKSFHARHHTVVLITSLRLNKLNSCVAEF